MFSSKCVLRIDSAISDSLRIVDKELCGMHCWKTGHSDFNHPGAWSIAVSIKAGSHKQREDKSRQAPDAKLAKLPKTHHQTITGRCTNIKMDVGTTSIMRGTNGYTLRLDLGRG